MVMKLGRLAWAGATALALTLGFGASAHAACELNKVLDLPVTLVDGRPVVPVTINGVKIQMLADSGATFSSLDPALADSLKLRREGAPLNMRIASVGGEVEPSAAHVRSMVVGGVDLPNRDVLLLPPGRGVSGILGQDMLGVFDIEYDLAHSAVRLMKPTGCSKASLAYWPGGDSASVIDIDLSAHPERIRVENTVGTAYLNGVRLKVTFDTGAQVSTLSRQAAERAGFKPGGPGVTSAGQLFGGGRRPVQAWSARFATFKIGDEQISNPQIRFADLGLDGSDMLLGADFFLSHRVYVANSQHKLYLTYDGGPIFGQKVRQDLSNAAVAVATGGEAAPADVEGLLRSGVAARTRRDLDGASADFTKAADLAPTDPRPFFERAVVRLDSRQPALAMADLDHALMLKPDLLPALVLRARLRLSERDAVGAAADADAAVKLSTPQDDAHLGFGDLYRAVGRYDAAVSEFDAWIAVHPDDSRMAEALFGRCRSRGITGRELPKALADCNRALGLAPKAAGILESRALVRYKLADYDKAIQDYDAALAASPKLALAFYGRGAAKLAKGLEADGQSDIQAAIAIQPKIEAQAMEVGLAGRKAATAVTAQAAR